MKGWTSRIAALLTVGAVLLGAAPFSTSAQTRAGLTVSTGLEAAALADYLLSAPLASTEGSAVATCSDKCQIGTFSDAAGLTGLDGGVILSTGDAAADFNPGDPASKGFPSVQNQPDGDLTRLNGGAATKDTAVLEFELIATGDLLNFQYVFASSEFEQDEPYNDVFGLFIDGENIALLPDGSPVTIQNLKASNRFLPDPDFERSGFNGISTVLTCSRPVTPGQRVKVKIAIGDVIDNAFDSAVLLKAGCLNFEPARSAIDFEAETLINLDPAATYTITAGDDIYSVTADAKGEIPLAGTDDDGGAYRLFGRDILLVPLSGDAPPRLIAVGEKPAKPAAPSGPSSLPGGGSDIAIAGDTLTVSGVAGQVYSLDGGASWRVAEGNPPHVVFEGLIPGRTYSLITRVPATGTTFASDPSEALTFELLSMFGADDFAVSPENGPYDGLDHTIAIQAPAGVTVTYAAAPSGPYGDTPPSYRNAGRYTIYYRAEQNGWYPYYGQAELLIGRAGLTVVPLPDQEKFTGQADPELRYTYRGAIPGETPAFTGALSRESGEAPGRYAIDSGSLALADGDGFRADNYTLTCEEDTLFTVRAAAAGLEDLILSPGAELSIRENPSAWNRAPIVLTPSNGYTRLSLDGSAWTDTLTLSSPGENQAASLYLQKPDGTIAQPITVYYNLDTEAPAGIRASYAPNRFFQFLHTVTFGLFFRETVTVTLTAEDSLSGVREFTYTLSDGRTGSTASSFRIDPQFIGSFIVTASDEAGNESAPVSFEAFAVDSEAPDVPTLSFGGYTPGQWTNTAVTVTVSGSSSLSGIKGYQVRTGNGPWQDMPALETAPATSEAPASVLSSILTADTDGETAYAFRAVSNNGLAGPATDPVVIAIDRTVPTVSVSAGGYTGGWTREDVTFTLSTVSSAPSSVVFEYSSDDGQTWHPLPGGILTLSQDICAAYRFRAVSEAGTAGEASPPIEVKIQKTPPPPAALVLAPEQPDGDDGWYVTNPTATITPPEPAGHPAPFTVYVQLYIGSVPIPALPFSSEAVLSLPGDGVYTLRVWTEDAAGNLSPVQTRTLSLDSAAPTGEILLAGQPGTASSPVPPCDFFRKEDVPVEITGNDGGDVSIAWQFLPLGRAPESDGWTPGNTLTLVPGQKGVVWARLTDRAGHMTLLCSRGTAVYSDASLASSSAFYSPDPSMPDHRDILIPLSWNGNTLDAIRLGDILLAEGTDYLIREDGVRLKKEALASFRDWPAKLALTIRPLDEPYAALPGNEAPVPMIFTVYNRVSAALPLLTEVPDGKMVYFTGEEAAPLRIQAVSPDGGTLSYQWYRNGQVLEGATQDHLIPSTAIPGVSVYTVSVTNTNADAEGQKTAVLQSPEMPVSILDLSLGSPVSEPGLPPLLSHSTLRELFPLALGGQDLLRLEQGGSLTLSFSIRPSRLTDAQKRAWEQHLEPETGGICLRLALDKTAVDAYGNEQTDELVYLSAPVRLTFAVPDSLQKSGRIFTLLSLDGDSWTLHSDLDSDTGTITIETDTLGEFALVYRDPSVSSPGTNAGGSVPLVRLAFWSSLTTALLAFWPKGKKKVPLRRN